MPSRTEADPAPLSRLALLLAARSRCFVPTCLCAKTPERQVPQVAECCQAADVCEAQGLTPNLQLHQQMKAIQAPAAAQPSSSSVPCRKRLITDAVRCTVPDTRALVMPVS